MPFADTSIPSIQLGLLESYLKERYIDVDTRHLYLFAADFFGIQNYNFLINAPNDSYFAQMIFSKYLFEDHWRNNIKKFKDSYNNIIGSINNNLAKFSFEKYVEKSDQFISWAYHNIDWNSYDLIGFTLNYGQFLPSLALSKMIKNGFPEKKIIFGGSTVINELGINILKTFNWIDFIIAGEGEESLFLLANNQNTIYSIPGLIYRFNNEIRWNKNEDFIDINDLPYPIFHSYYNDLNKVSDELKQYHLLYGRLPIELSRGCWWNKCTFCNISTHHKEYREKTNQRFIEELKYISEEYRVIDFQIIGNTLPKNNIQDFCTEILKLKRDFSFCIEARAGYLTQNDYTLLKNAGFNYIQTGIETFSSNYLRKMNKGVKVIDNIAALKHCRENDIINSYNLIINYPNEEKKDFIETLEITDLFKNYLDPPQLSNFVVGFGSPIYTHFKQFNIEKLVPKTTDKIMFPQEILDNNICIFNQFKRIQKSSGNDWHDFLDNWRKDYTHRSSKGAVNQNPVDKLVFYYIDGKTFLKIVDARNRKNVIIFLLNQFEREIFLSCIDIISFDELIFKFQDYLESEFKESLQDMIDSRLIYREGDLLLSLPLSFGKIKNRIDRENKVNKVLLKEI
jgi:ribosomal peptide maturation radical SAM protein 1